MWNICPNIDLWFQCLLTGGILQSMLSSLSAGIYSMYLVQSVLAFIVTDDSETVALTVTKFLFAHNNYGYFFALHRIIISVVHISSQISRFICFLLISFWLSTCELINYFSQPDFWCCRSLEITNVVVLLSFVSTSQTLYICNVADSERCVCLILDQ